MTKIKDIGSALLELIAIERKKQIIFYIVVVVLNSIPIVIDVCKSTINLSIIV